MAEQPEGYELVMPFTVVISAGGPYEDAAFVAGFQAGVIYADLGQDMPAPGYWVPSALVTQLDLVAMRWGFKMYSEEWDQGPEWTHVWFRRTSAGA